MDVKTNQKKLLQNMTLQMVQKAGWRMDPALKMIMEQLNELKKLRKGK
jgi:hypothetical protein